MNSGQQFFQTSTNWNGSLSRQKEISEKWTNQDMAMTFAPSCLSCRGGSKFIHADLQRSFPKFAIVSSSILSRAVRTEPLMTSDGFRWPSRDSDFACTWITPNGLRGYDNEGIGWHLHFYKQGTFSHSPNSWNCEVTWQFFAYSTGIIFKVLFFAYNIVFQNKTTRKTQTSYPNIPGQITRFQDQG